MMRLACISLMLLMMLRRPPDAKLVLQSFYTDDYCAQESILCDASVDYSYLMEINPVAAALWMPCHVRSSRVGGTFDALTIDGGPQELFTIGVCTSVGGITLRVVHHDQRACTVPDAATMKAMGLSISDLVKDYIEVLLDGPERRLQRMEFASNIESQNATDNASNACEYGLQLPIQINGTYRVQVMVVHSDITLTGIEPYQNYVLWDRIHNLSAPTRNRVSIDPKDDGPETWRSTGGWMRTKGKSIHGLHSAQALVAQQWNDGSYRCPVNGTASFTWVPLTSDLPTEPGTDIMAPRSDYAPLKPQEAMACARALAPQHKGIHPKLVLFGDSLMRQTFNAVALAIGMENVTAIKEFKSLMESQDWGGASIGLELSFQWAARHNEGRSTLKAMLKQGAYVLVNYGAHPLCDGTMLDNLRMFDDWLAFLGDVLKDLPSDTRSRVAWLGSHPRPIMGYNRLCPTPSSYIRTAARDQAWVHYTHSKLTEVGIQYVDVFNLIEPFRDCTQDGSHHILGVPNAVATHRIIPWICSQIPK